jgi:uncharacterized protein (DUF427 family)
MAESVERESVWDYPRPPRWELSSREIEVIFAGSTIAKSNRAIRVLETSHPPTYYLPPADILDDVLLPTDRRSLCEWKGAAQYFDVKVGDSTAKSSAWSYPEPTATFESIRNYVAFYAHLMDACYVDGERVQAQPGSFYGGWITSDLDGPFKGGPGTRGW